MTIVNTINISDRGLAYGDGLFETIAVVNGVLHHWDLHWQRLNLGAERLALHLPKEKEILQHISEKLTSLEQQVIKIIITRGSGGRGYVFPETQHESLIISSHAWPERDAGDYLNGIDTIVCQTRLARQPALAGIKHLNRLEQVLARNEFNDDDYQEGIMLCYAENTGNMASLVVEGTSSNLFFVKNSVLYTPKIKDCGVAGTMRQAIISYVQATQCCHVEQDNYTLQQLSQAEEVFFTNSIYGIMPVASITIDETQQWFYQHRVISNQLAVEFNRPLMRPFIFKSN